MTLAHNIPDIIPGKKDVVFKRGSIVKTEDVERLLDFGKRNIHAVAEKELEKVEGIGKSGVIQIRPLKEMKAGLVITGSEVFAGRIQNGSASVKKKLKGYGLTIVGITIVPDDIDKISNSIYELFQRGADLVIKTTGLSVDPDDVTRESTEAAGAEVLFYGTPVFPGAMFLIVRLKGKYILDVPACVYYNNNTALDVVLPRIIAGERMGENDMVKLSYGVCAFTVPPVTIRCVFSAKGLRRNHHDVCEKKYERSRYHYKRCRRNGIGNCSSPILLKFPADSDDRNTAASCGQAHTGLL